MKSIIKVVYLIALPLPLFFSSMAQADINAALQNICTIVKADDKGELRKKMKRVRSDFNLKLKDYYGGISCNGNSLIRTAMLNNSVNVGSLLIKKMPKKSLAAPEKDGKTVHDWALENNLADSPIVAVLKGRI